MRPYRHGVEFLETRVSSESTITVAALGHERILATSVTLPLEILRAAAQASELRPKPRVTLQLMTADGGPLSLVDGLCLSSSPIDTRLEPDVLLIPAIWRHPRWVLRRHRWQLDFIQRCVARGSWVCGVGSGSFLIAESGVLDGGSATTHWQWFDDFHGRYPNVRLHRDQLITQSGRIFCVGSVNSIADLMVYMSGLLISRRSAVAIENQFSPEIRRRYSPHALMGTSQAHNDEQVLDAQLTLRANLSEPLDLRQLSKSIGLTPRTLNRRFKAATGSTPGEYLQQLRIEEARNLLHHSNLPIGEVGWSVGFRDASNFSRQFREVAGVSPRRYRMAVRGKSFSVPMDTQSTDQYRDINDAD